MYLQLSLDLLSFCGLQVSTSCPDGLIVDKCVMTKTLLLWLRLRPFWHIPLGKKWVIGRIQFSDGVIFQIDFDPNYNQQKILFQTRKNERIWPVCDISLLCFQTNLAYTPCCCLYISFSQSIELSALIRRFIGFL